MTAEIRASGAVAHDREAISAQVEVIQDLVENGTEPARKQEELPGELITG